MNRDGITYEKDSLIADWFSQFSTSTKVESQMLELFSKKMNGKVLLMEGHLYVFKVERVNPLNSNDRLEDFQISYEETSELLDFIESLEGLDTSSAYRHTFNFKDGYIRLNYAENTLVLVKYE